MFGAKKFPIPRILPKECPDCGKKLKWEAITIWDPVIAIEKPDHYRGICKNGHEHRRDGRGQVVELPTPNLPPDVSEFAQSPQGKQPYSGYLEFVKQERAKAEELKAKQAAAAAARAAPPAQEGGAAPAEGGGVATAEAPPAAPPAAAEGEAPAAEGG